MFSLNEWFPKTKAVLDSVQADIVLACLLLNSTQVLAELGSAHLKHDYFFSGPTNLSLEPTRIHTIQK